MGIKNMQLPHAIASSQIRNSSNLHMEFPTNNRHCHILIRIRPTIYARSGSDVFFKGGLESIALADALLIYRRFCRKQSSRTDGLSRANERVQRDSIWPLHVSGIWIGFTQTCNKGGHRASALKSHERAIKAWIKENPSVGIDGTLQRSWDGFALEPRAGSQVREEQRPEKWKPGQSHLRVKRLVFIDGTRLNTKMTRLSAAAGDRYAAPLAGVGKQRRLSPPCRMIGLRRRLRQTARRRKKVLCLR